MLVKLKLFCKKYLNRSQSFRGIIVGDKVGSISNGKKEHYELMVTKHTIMGIVDW